MATTQRSLDVAEMGIKTKDELLDLAQDVGLTDGAALTNLRREELLSRLFQVASAQQALIASGILEIMDEGYGFLRQVEPPGFHRRRLYFPVANPAVRFANRRYRFWTGSASQRRGTIFWISPGGKNQ